MTTYIISYDLREPDRDYDKLYKKLKAYSNWAHITDSTWAVVSSNSAKEVRKDLAAVLDGDDRIFVVPSRRGAAWRNVKCGGQRLKDVLAGKPKR